MFIYAIGVLPLIKAVGHPERSGAQVWYANDASACADLETLKDWLSGLLNEGPKHGYLPKPSKSYVVVNERSIKRANVLFSPLGVKVVTSHRFLGGVIGDNDGQKEFLRSRVKEWSHILNQLSEIAIEQPQAAYAALTKSIQNKWQFVQRLVPNCQEILTDIDFLTQFCLLSLAVRFHSRREIFSLFPLVMVVFMSSIQLRLVSLFIPPHVRSLMLSFHLLKSTLSFVILTILM